MCFLARHFGRVNQPGYDFIIKADCVAFFFFAYNNWLTDCERDFLLKDIK